MTHTHDTKNFNVRTLRNRREIDDDQFVEIKSTLNTNRRMTSNRRRVDTTNDVSFMSMNANVERLN